MSEAKATAARVKKVEQSGFANGESEFVIEFSQSIPFDAVSIKLGEMPQSFLLRNAMQVIQSAVVRAAESILADGKITDKAIAFREYIRKVELGQEPSARDGSGAENYVPPLWHWVAQECSGIFAALPLAQRETLYIGGPSPAIGLHAILKHLHQRGLEFTTHAGKQVKATSYVEALYKAFDKASPGVMAKATAQWESAKAAKAAPATLDDSDL